MTSALHRQPPFFVAEIPIDPFPKERPRVGRGRLYTPAKTATYEREVAKAVKAAAPADGCFNEVDGLLCVTTFDVAVDDGQWKDIDNCQKAVFDAVTAAGVVWADDRQVLADWGEISYGASAGLVRIEVSVWLEGGGQRRNGRSRRRKKPSRAVPAGFELCPQCGKRAVVAGAGACWSCVRNPS